TRWRRSKPSSPGDSSRETPSASFCSEYDSRRKGSTLTIHGISQDDDAIYQCIAENSAGSTQDIIGYVLHIQWSSDDKTEDHWGMSHLWERSKGFDMKG
ncbi:unnamed protein product, partial [Gadus morhua 'NCC']